ncbi:NAD kinase [Dissostichus eleginoides]|uniref:NAD kinase n=1 Tax=Dissostichus eleginoides TaxID=100907 RepID=A0AAD9B4W4_DISEL|nr:NAD kinase [Dissostichus eleginoides]
MSSVGSSLRGFFNCVCVLRPSPCPLLVPLCGFLTVFVSSDRHHVPVGSSLRVLVLTPQRTTGFIIPSRSPLHFLSRAALRTTAGCCLTLMRKMMMRSAITSCLTWRRIYRAPPPLACCPAPSRPAPTS